MARVRRIVNLSDFRSALATNDEIEIGLSVRRRRRQQVAIAALGLVLLGAAAWLYFALRVPASESLPGAYRVKVLCISCQAVESRLVTPRDTFPLVCKKCHQRGAKALVACRDCGHEFLPPEVGQIVRCPRCEGTRVGSAASQPAPAGP